LAAPILVFTAEEIWRYLPKSSAAPNSVHIALFPEEAELGTGISPAQIKAWELLAKVRAEVLKALETARNEKKINSGLEAKVLLGGNPELRARLNNHVAQLAALFIVSQVEFLTAGASDYKSELVPSLEISIQKADGKKCERC